MRCLEIQQPKGNKKCCSKNSTFKSSGISIQQSFVVVVVLVIVVIVLVIIGVDTVVFARRSRYRRRRYRRRRYRRRRRSFRRLHHRRLSRLRRRHSYCNRHRP